MGWTAPFWKAAGAMAFEPPLAPMLDQHFAQNASRRVAGAEEEDVLGLSSTACPVPAGLARFNGRGGHEIFDAAAGRPACDQFTALRPWRHPHIDKACLRPPALDPLDRRRSG